MSGYPVQPRGTARASCRAGGRVRVTKTTARPHPRGGRVREGPTVSPDQSSRGGVNRTLNRSFWRRVLYQLSYAPVPVIVISDSLLVDSAGTGHLWEGFSPR